MLGAVHHQHQAPVAYRTARMAARTLFADKCAAVLDSEPADARLPAKALVQARAFFYQQGILCVQDEQAVPSDQVRHTELHVGEAVEIIDTVFTKVIGADVSDD